MSGKEKQTTIKVDVSLFAEIKLKENDGTQRISFKMMEFVNWIVPICATGAKESFGSLTKYETMDVMEVKSVVLQTIWSEALVSVIQLIEEWFAELCVCVDKEVNVPEFWNKMLYEGRFEVDC